MWSETRQLSEECKYLQLSGAQVRKQAEVSPKESWWMEAPSLRAA